MNADAMALWNALAYEVIKRLALTERAFSTDDVWAVLEPLPRPTEPRALGPVLHRARKDGLVVKSDVTVNSERAVCHARPANIWLSRPLRAELADACAYAATRKSRIDLPLFSATATNGEIANTL